MTEAEIDLTVASLRMYREGLGLDEKSTRRIIMGVDAEGGYDPTEFRDEVRLRMLAVSQID